ncbi:MAG: aldo/keto reductase [Defluviitaleaceae bacterium]|nr:aldo/keto reductase [Defluviitaleaceae bacterium]
MTTLDYLKPTGKSALGFGAMRLPGEKETAAMVDIFLDAGFNYFDTAYIYGGSEELLKKTLVSRHARDSFIVADKLPPWEVRESPQDCNKLFEEQLRRTGLDYFDFYLIHSLDEGREEDVEKKGLFEWAAEQKKKGLVKHVGFSFHGGAAYLDRLLTRHPEVEFVQLQLNYADVRRGPAGEWNEIALRHNTPIVVMEPIRGGALANLPAPAEKIFRDHAPERSMASWAMQYAATLPGVTCVLSGMSNVEHVKDNVKTFQNLQPLTPHELGLIDAALTEMAKVAGVPCTACRYCHNECPQDINIAECFSLYNDLKRGGAGWNLSMVYRTIPKGKRAADCTNCGACLAHCPQHIDIPKELGVVAGAM